MNDTEADWKRQRKTIHQLRPPVSIADSSTLIAHVLHTTIDCRVCNAIIHAYSRPLRRRELICIGKVEDVLSGTCSNHEDMMKGCFGDWEVLGLKSYDVAIFKEAGDSYLRTFVGNTLYSPPFELVYEPSMYENSFLGTSGCTGHNPRSSIGFHRGKILDADWIQSNTIGNWYQMCKSVHGIVCDDPSLRKKLIGRPNFLIHVSEDCIVSAKPDYVYIA
jgi:hypothetical protein